MSVLALSACVPGQQMSRSDVQDSQVVGNDVRMVTITPEVVAAPAKVATIPTELSGYTGEAYRIQPGDTLIVTVWDHPELTTPAGNQQQAVTNGRLVQPDGTFYWALMKHADIVSVSRNPTLFSAERGGVVLEDLPPEQLEQTKNMLLMMDPPRHTELRGKVYPHFRPVQMRRMEARIRELCRQILAVGAERGDEEFVHGRRRWLVHRTCERLAVAAVVLVQ